MPLHNAPKGNVLNISRADIYRLTEPISSPLQLSDEEFANRSNLIAALALTDADFGAKVLNYKDALEFAGQAARLRYAIRFVNASGTESCVLECSPDRTYVQGRRSADFPVGRAVAGGYQINLDQTCSEHRCFHTSECPRLQHLSFRIRQTAGAIIE
jgi:hypothetical protein